MFDELQLTEQEHTGLGRTAHLLDGGLSMAMEDTPSGKNILDHGEDGNFGVDQRCKHQTFRNETINHEWVLGQPADVDITDRRGDFSNARWCFDQKIREQK